MTTRALGRPPSKVAKPNLTPPPPLDEALARGRSAPTGEFAPITTFIAHTEASVCRVRLLEAQLAMERSSGDD